MPVQKKPLKDPTQVGRARQVLTRRSARASMERLQHVLCEPVRLNIIQALSVGPLCVNDLAAVIERAPAATSQHLRVLRRVGLVDRTRQGTTAYYQLRPSPAAAHLNAVLQSLQREDRPPA